MAESDSRNRRTPRKFLQKCASYISEIFDPDFAGEKSISCHVAEKLKELNPLTQPLIRRCIVSIGNLVQSFLLLLWRAIEIDLAVVVRAYAVQPHQAST